jgi:hypothetical protein
MMEPTPGFEPGTFSLPSNHSVVSGGREISSTTFHRNRQDSTLYLLNFWDDLRTEGPILPSGGWVRASFL